MVNTGSPGSDCEVETKCAMMLESAVYGCATLALDSAVRIHLLRGSDACEDDSKCGWWRYVVVASCRDESLLGKLDEVMAEQKTVER